MHGDGRASGDAGDLAEQAAPGPALCAQPLGMVSIISSRSCWPGRGLGVMSAAGASCHLLGWSSRSKALWDFVWVNFSQHALEGGDRSRPLETREAARAAAERHGRAGNVGTPSLIQSQVFMIPVRAGHVRETVSAHAANGFASLSHRIRSRPMSGLLYR